MEKIQSVIQQTISALRAGKTILYPTDTVWGLGCDALSPSAVSEVFRLKKRPAKKSLILLVSSVEMLKEYVSPSAEIRQFLQAQTRPTTVVYSAPKGLPPEVVSAENTVAIRVVQTGFCTELIRQFGRAIVSTSANISGEPTPADFSQISAEIKKNVGYVVDYQQEESAGHPSQLVALQGGKIIFLRK